MAHHACSLRVEEAVAAWWTTVGEGNRVELGEVAVVEGPVDRPRGWIAAVKGWPIIG
ncbi:MAG: hypothetical protein AABZ12_09960 [Planctomycetota bacterium]